MKALLQSVTRRARKGVEAVRKIRRKGAAFRKQRKPKKERRLPGWVGLALVLVKLGVAAGVLYAAVGVGFYVYALRYDLRELRNLPERTLILDRNGDVLGRLSGENRVVVRLAEVPDHFVDALLAREDTRFYRHLGVDPVGIARAAVRNLLLGGIRQGGSTITQQLARNTFPLGGRTFQRKLLEAALAFRIETELSKEEILESYINRIYFGEGCYGLETASRVYFDKPAARLTLAESALLAGLIRSPSRLSPFQDMAASVRQRNVVLARMLELGWITEQQHAAARAERVNLSRKPRVQALENWVLDAVRRELEPLLETLDVDASGLVVHTSLDGSLQQAAERAVAEGLAVVESRSEFLAARAEDGREAAQRLQAALIALDRRDGGVLAMVGSRDFRTSTYNRAVVARRQAGSVVKPFVYAAALTAGVVKPKSPVSDQPLQPGEIPAQYGRYSPANHDGVYDSARPAEDCVVFSRNPLTVRLGLRAGLGRTTTLMERAGIAPKVPVLPSSLLGTFDVTLRDVTGAMAVFPNGGWRAAPHVVKKLQDRKGRVIYQHRQVRTPVLEPHVCAEVVEAMEAVLVRGTGAGARRMGFDGRGGGKTGTTDGFRDAWFVGFSGHLVAGVWVGFDRPRMIYRGATGGQVALPLWVRLMMAPAAAAWR